MAEENASDSYADAARRSVRECLERCVAVASHRGDVDSAFVQLREALIDWGLRTSENVAAMDRVDFGEGKPDAAAAKSAAGLRAKASGYLLSDVLWRLEDEPIPPAIRDDLPDLSQEDWSALLRVATLLLTAFEA